MSKSVLSWLSLEELKALFSPLPPFRAKQVYQWILRGSRSFQDMTDLSRDLREELDSRFTLYSSMVSSRLEDPDGTLKLKIALGDGAKIEGVLLVDGEGRRTACLSTQAGCPMACVFCKTGALGFRRNLDGREIVEQFLHIRSAGAGLKGAKTPSEGPEIANIVIMGMGEPLLNLRELRRALGILTDPDGLGISKRRITVSTSGIIPGIFDLADQGPEVRLAVSLTTADEDLRKGLMPVTLTNPLPRLKDALIYYQRKTRRRLTLEVVLLGGLNTRRQDLEALADFAAGLEVVVNLIPWNPVEGMEFEGRPLAQPTPREIVEFSEALIKRGIGVTRRLGKGLGVSGACGQLGEPF
ncbi:MAG: 23S rRNA (adenine(2503)-C(2))-methyltransferase RlmN [Spirochaetaceae bacterium]|jgi:23S rRNA (adenine2503-C2)-methyltransferase|nr:23S rRNA (adenine(2503)-C(2))-methyltransferase RlmN [Spirochaetaceae bacterium]